MQHTTNNLKNTPVKSIVAGIVLATSMLAVSTDATAYDLKANTIYANAKGGIYEINLDTEVATKVADTNASLSSIQDIAFDGSTLYGINYNWQLLKLEPNQNETVAINEASSFSLQFQGLEARDGVLYGAETRSLVTIDKATADTGLPGPGASSYGLGAGEQVTDLAFAEDGTLYASVDFPGIAYTYFGAVDSATGTLNLIGNTGATGIRAITVKDGIVYAMNSVGDLFTLNKVSGFSTTVATAVLPGVYGMDTSPAKIDVVDENTGTADESTVTTTAGSAGGSLSVYWMLMLVLVAGLRRIR